VRYSRLFGKTVRRAPRDAASVSERLLYEGGFIRRFSAGRYAFLPLGFRVWQKISEVIDEEMRKIGCQRLAVPILHPIEVWQATNRDKAFGDLMLVVSDHHGATFAIGATAEGMMVELVKKFRPSYRDLPIVVYQFSQKFRDEKRPRGGLLRTREFMMKDAYSFCRTEEESLEIYQRFYDAYIRIAERLDLEAVPVEADSGAIGGTHNHEFIVLSEAGESKIFICDKCGYAASEERAEFERVDLTPNEEEKPFEIIEQPEWVTTMEDNQKHYGKPLYKYLKNVVYRTSRGEIVIASVRGDQEVSEAKLRRVLGVGALEPADEKDLEEIGTKPGYVHSWGIEGVRFVGDLGLTKVKNFIGGQKTKTTDSINVNYGRDFKCEILADIVKAKDGDPCLRCRGGRLRERRGIEYGHCFKQDHFYTGPQKGYFVDEDGQEKPLWMGAYGIGIGRAMATVVETHHDEKGIIWPRSIAPFEVHLLSINMEDSGVVQRAEELYQKLNEKGFEVLYDDRDESAGVKFADADLIGIPWRVVVSRHSLDKGGLEVKERSKKETKVVTSEKLLRCLSTAY